MASTPFGKAKACSRDFERDLMVNMGLVAEDLGAVPYVLCAAPSYFAQHGVPTSPHDLAEHNCLVHTTQKPVAARWHFAKGTESYGLPVGGTFHSNLEQAILLAAVRGVGIARLPEYTVSSELADGRLRAVFQGQVQSNRLIKAFYPRSKYVSTKVRAFIECIKKRYEPVPVGA